MNKFFIQTKNKLKKYIPNTYEFSELKDKTLKKKVLEYKERLDKLAKIPNGENINYTPHCIFDLVFLADSPISKDEKCKSLLDLLESTISSLKLKVPTRLIPKLKDSVRQIIISLDKNPGTNFQYLNFFAELLGLDSILSRPQNQLELIDIERKLPNGKSVDFVFQLEKEPVPLYVDFFSIHNIDVEKIENQDDFLTYFLAKFEKKLAAKTDKLIYNNGNLNIEGKEIPFFIQPIIWEGDIRKFKRCEDAFKILNEKYTNVASCISLLVQMDSKGRINYQMTSVTNILELI